MGLHHMRQHLGHTARPPRREIASSFLRYSAVAEHGSNPSLPSRVVLLLRTAPEPFCCLGSRPAERQSGARPTRNGSGFSFSRVIASSPSRDVLESLREHTRPRVCSWHERRSPRRDIHITRLAERATSLMNRTPISNVLQQCPFCDAHGLVTLVARTIPTGATFDWRCTNCFHQWSAVQSITPSTQQEPIGRRQSN